jgi:hypothetical protein
MLQDQKQDQKICKRDQHLPDIHRNDVKKFGISGEQHSCHIVFLLSPSQKSLDPSATV